eukprot:SAG31_NODE_64_length_28590_cov_17.914464_21_plen_82_part_00
MFMSAEAAQQATGVYKLRTTPAIGAPILVTVTLGKNAQERLVIHLAILLWLEKSDQEVPISVRKNDCESAVECDHNWHSVD